ncbi:SDR family NAD(P)-dependent oxidoreductase [Frondihabitans australicus]|uniref:NAD(P)-dependent dehydrogenase (Short-subunit alcohol dehydrogenase family) n=1 Tax=Frondihabitans australicus TaxID=386892 RepID=A0A495IEH7_9MICO|nr:SDR family NAD(P)-dependent oxidoreductase [Frondihabitans australicus]RKR73416.1 NAD(P)-dependent dehydrogenase (short-subunit alcohol dehydrogenase family) [Frondihabitans australicus]
MARTTRWTRDDLGPQDDRTVVVTGGSGGIGLRTAEVFAERGARVIIGARDAAKATAAVDSVRAAARRAGRTTRSDGVDWRPLDLADLGSVRGFADDVLGMTPSIDLLVNCAGVMAIPECRLTADGIEMHFGTNHIGHFALTGLLLPALGAGRPARVVTVSAQSARTARLDVDDLQRENPRYAPMAAYGNSKLANVLFAVELNRHVDPARVLSVPVHPGTARTGIQQYSTSRVYRGVGQVIMRAVGQPLDRVADPIAFAATSPEATPMSFVAPTGPFELGGAPGFVRLPAQADDDALRAALWAESERLSGVAY